jgi:hypothetical protein
MHTLDFDALLDALRELVGHDAKVYARREHMSDGFHDGRATLDVASATARVHRIRRSSRVNERWWIELGHADDEEFFVTFTVDRLGLEWARVDETSVSYGQEGMIFELHRLEA